MLKFESITKHQRGLIAELLLHGFAGVMDNALHDKIKEFDKEVFEKPDTVGACVFISTLNGNSVGMASWDPRQWPELGIIGYNCILPEFQNRSFGKAQIKEILDRLKQKGFKKACVRTGEHPFFTSAQKMYAACGFNEIKRHPTGDQPGYGTIDYDIEL
jgi:GNAT superfamily N-acetyltransferase